MKFAFPLLVFSLFLSPLSAQEEVPLEEVFQKIEARVSSIESVSGRYHLEGSSEMMSQMTVSGWFGCRPGKFMRKQTFQRRKDLFEGKTMEAVFG